MMLAVSANATIVNLDLGPPRAIRPESGVHTGEIYVESDALNGTPVMGQSLSLDYVFNNLVRLNPNDNINGAGWYAAIRAQLDVVPAPGVYPSVCSSAYMIRADGSHGPTLVSDASGFISGPNVHELLFGIVFPDGPDSGVLRAYSGMHFDLVLPDMGGVEITGLRAHMDAGFRNWHIVESVPDAGSTLGLLGLALVAVSGFRTRSQNMNDNT